MTSPTATLEAPAAVACVSAAEGCPAAAHSIAEAARELARSLAAAIPARRLQLSKDDELLEAMSAIEQLGRYVDALRVEAAAEVAHRSTGFVDRADALSARKGCRNAVELIERVTLVSGATATRRIKLGHETRVELAAPGMPSPARFRFVSDALEAGLIGVDAASAIVAGLVPTFRHASIDGLSAAEEELVSCAIGTSDLVPTACTADEIRDQALVWQAYLDPDGMEPVERRAWNARGFQSGALVGGLVCGRFALMPEVAAKLNRLFDAFMSPRSKTEFRTEEEQAEADRASDSRTRDQQRHDIIASMVDHYSRSDQVPKIGGAAPTVIVTVRGEDLDRGHGRGYIDGAKAPVSMRTIRHLACTGGFELLSIDSDGSVHGMGSTQRCFTPAQRRAIMVRDGGCAIPGCTIPAAWTEIHHVDPAENGGPTETDNGVLLCWFHHRTIETSGWQIKMIGGVPHIKAPPWINYHDEWRPSTKSPTMRLDNVEKRAQRT